MRQSSMAACLLLVVQLALPGCEDASSDDDSDADHEDGAVAADDSSVVTDEPGHDADAPEEHDARTGDSDGSTGASDAETARDASNTTDPTTPADAAIDMDATTVDAANGDATSLSDGAIADVGTGGPAACALWDSFPPSTTFSQLVRTQNGFAIADDFQIYAWTSGAWTLWRTAPTEPYAPAISQLAAGSDFLGAVLEDGTVIRGASPPMSSVGTFQLPTALTAFQNRLWLATNDSKLRLHDGSGWSEIGTTSGPIVTMVESTQGLVAFTNNAGYLRDASGFRPFPVPDSGFKRAAATDGGDVLVATSYKVYRFNGSGLVEEARPADCTEVYALFGGARAILQCGSGYFQRDGMAVWNRVAFITSSSERAVSLSATQLVCTDTASLLDFVSSGVRSPVPRTASSMPLTPKDIGGRSGGTPLVGGPQGVFRLSGDTFTQVQGTATFDVRALWEQADGDLITATMARLKPCTQSGDCGSNQFCSQGFCGGPASVSDDCLSAGCPQGTTCARISGSTRFYCYQSVEIHQTTSGGVDSLLHTDYGFPAPIAIYASDDSSTIYVPLDYSTYSDTLLTYANGSWAHYAAFGANCVVSDHFPQFAYVPPSSILGRYCSVLYGGSYTGQDLIPIQLTDPLTALLLARQGGSSLLLTAAGSVPFPLTSSDIPGNTVGGTSTKLIAFRDGKTSGTLSVQSGTAWPATNVPFHELKPRKFWSTDGWKTVYALVRSSALLRCRL